MTAIAWTLVGLMAASLSVLATALFGGFGRVEGRFGLMENRFDRIDSRLDALFARIDAQGSDLRADIREVRHAVQSLDQRLTRAGG